VRGSLACKPGLSFAPLYKETMKMPAALCVSVRMYENVQSDFGLF